MRSYNDSAIIGQTLAALSKQSFQDYEIWNHDSNSTDNTIDIIKKFVGAKNIRVNSSQEYIPGRVLNRAVDLCQGDIVVFLNSDATPVSKHWLGQLVESIAVPGMAAVYGRQVARQNCQPLFIKDTERAFGDGYIAADWSHFFSMANAASHKKTLVQYRFNETLNYSEDIEWSYRLKQAGLMLAYNQTAVCRHSHNYSLPQSYQRHYGEGAAEANIFTHGEVNFKFFRYSLGPCLMEIARDLVWAWKTKSAQAAVHSIPLRCTQKWARWQGSKSQLGA